MGKTLGKMIEKMADSFVEAMKGKKFEYTARHGLVRERNVTYEKKVYKIQDVLYSLHLRI